jgi:hypothetical protein
LVDGNRGFNIDVRRLALNCLAEAISRRRGWSTVDQIRGSRTTKLVAGNAKTASAGERRRGQNRTHAACKFRGAKPSMLARKILEISRFIQARGTTVAKRAAASQHSLRQGIIVRGKSFHVAIAPRAVVSETVAPPFTLAGQTESPTFAACNGIA